MELTSAKDESAARQGSPGANERAAHAPGSPDARLGTAASSPGLSLRAGSHLRGTWTCQALRTILILTLFGTAVRSSAAPIADGLSKVGVLATMPLPLELKEFSDYALSKDGMLFVADKASVWVWSPWGWEKIWSPSKPPEAIARPINALAVVRDAQDSEVLLIGTEEGLWSMGWEAREVPGMPWSVFAFHFSPGERLTAVEGATAETLRVTSLLPLSGGEAGARALAVSGSGISRMVVVSHGKLQIGAAPFGDEVLQSLVAFALPEGHVLCQEYGGGHELRLVSSAGKQLLKSNLDPVLGGKTQLRATAVDADRMLLFVGTDRGVIAARLDANGVPEGDWQMVEALRGFETIHLGWCGGRLLVIGNPLESAAKDAVQWESRLDKTVPAEGDFARQLRFTAASGGDFPGDIRDAVAVEEDAIWVRASDATFEWTPQQWRRLTPGEHGDLDSPSFWQVKPRSAPPVVIPDDTRQRLTWVIPRDARRITYHEAANPIAALVPDPSGFGFWSLDHASPGLPHTFHSLRFHSRHGQFDTSDAVKYGWHPEIARVEHRVAHGSEFADPASALQRTYLPETGDGSLLLPSGADLFRVKGAEWRELKSLTPLPEPERLLEMTPAAASGDAPWLALHHRADSSAELVSVDLDEAGTGWKISASGVRIPAQATARLIPESTGYVWLATRAAGRDWTMDRIGSTKLQLRFSTPANEVPQFIISRKPTLTADGPLLVRKTDRYIFSNSGVVTCEEERPGAWLSLLPTGSATPDQFLESHFSEGDAFLRTGAIDVGGTVSEGPTYLLSWSGGAASLTVPPSPPSLPPTQPFAFFPANLTGRLSAIWTVPGTAPIDSGPRTWWGVSGAASTPSFPSGEARAFTLPLPRLRAVEAAAVSAGSEFKSSTPPGMTVIAATGGSTLAIIPPASPAGWNDWLRPVPISMTARHRNGTEDTWNLRNGEAPKALPHEVVAVGVQFARDYDAWWKSLPLKIRGRAISDSGGDGPPWELADARDKVTLPVEAGRRYVLEFEGAEASGDSFAGIKTLPLAVEADPAPPPKRLLALLGVLVLTLAALALLVFSRLARRAVLRVLGRHWIFRAEECDVTIDVSWDSGEVLLTAERGGSVSVRHRLNAHDLTRCAEGDLPTLRSLRAALLPPLDETLQTVSIRTPESIFSLPFSSWIDGGWASPRAPAPDSPGRVCGRTALLGQMMATPPSRLKRVTYAGIGWPGTPPLLIRPELDAIENTFRRMHALVLNRGEKPADLLTALYQADIVHVAAHASLTEIKLRDGDFTASFLPDEVLRGIRCRLLILSACDAGGTAPDRPSIAWPLIRAGVTIIGSLVPLDDTVARRFFPLLYEHFLPVTTADGPRLAEGIVRAAASLAPILGAGESAPWRAYLNSLVLYGNPNLHLAVFHASAD